MDDFIDEELIKFGYRIYSEFIIFTLALFVQMQPIGFKQVSIPATMTIKESYLGIFLFLILAPALLLFAPGLPSYIFIGLLAGFYLTFQIRKPRRRCLPCGEIVTLTPVSYLKLVANNLDCPRCGTQIKNKHRV